MNKYLIFRTDRIGDFLLTAILIKSIKRNDPDCNITVVSSEKNFKYIYSFNIIDKVFFLKKGFFNKIKLFFLLNKNFYKSIVVHDSKNRSKIISFFLKSKKKYISNISKFESYFDEIKNILKYLNFNFDEADFNTLENREIYYSNFKQKDYILFHFDEKWIFNKYIKNYKNIEPSEQELKLFLISLSSKSKKNVIVTTGNNTPEILSKIFKNNFIDNIILIENINFFDLESLINNSSLLISCHGAVSHVAAAKKIKQIDIIDKNYNYKKWTKHFRNYQSINRKSFNELSIEILNLNFI